MLYLILNLLVFNSGTNWKRRFVCELYPTQDQWCRGSIACSSVTQASLSAPLPFPAAAMAQRKRNTCNWNRHPRTVSPRLLSGSPLDMHVTIQSFYRREKWGFSPQHFLSGIRLTFVSCTMNLFLPITCFLDKKTNRLTCQLQVTQQQEYESKHWRFGSVTWPNRRWKEREYQLPLAYFLFCLPGYW